MNKQTHFYLGANTSAGFVSKFDQLYGTYGCNRLYIIKGGPGTGKSGLMKKVAAEAERRGYQTQMIHCSSDPESLDAVIIPELHTAVCDGTAPHTMDPKWPGVVDQIINLGECWNTETLKNKKSRIIELTARISVQYERAYRFLKAAGSLWQDTFGCAIEATDILKMEKAAQRLAKQEWKTGNTTGTESRRYLSGITPQGIVTFFDQISQYPRVFMLDDEYGVGRLMLAHLRALALDAGHDVISCCCSLTLSDNPEHLLIPELGIAFITSNKFHPYQGEVYKTINMRRFVDVSLLKQRRPRISFNRRAVRELVDEAVFHIQGAKKLHDLLEQCYVGSMDFDSVNQKTQQLIEDIFD